LVNYFREAEKLACIKSGLDKKGDYPMPRTSTAAPAAKKSAERKARPSARTKT
jgi:hypothetical protein